MKRPAQMIVALALCSALTLGNVSGITDALVGDASINSETSETINTVQTDETIETSETTETTELTDASQSEEIGQSALTQKRDFSDMPKHWSNTYVSPLTEKGIITGYADGTFKPDNTLKRIEYIVLTLKALEADGQIAMDATVADGEYWGMPYIEKAIELGLLTSNSLDSAKYETAITREEMASIVMKAYAMSEDASVPNAIYDKAENLIKDAVNVSMSYQDAVIKAYALNFISGYSDGTFKPQGTATRGEASVVISRLIGDASRTPIAEDESIMGSTDWITTAQSLDAETRAKYLSPEFVNSTFIDGVLTIAENGYKAITTTDKCFPNQTEMLNNLISYMSTLTNEGNKYSRLRTVVRGNNGIEETQTTIVEYNVGSADTSQSYFRYSLYNDYYIGTDGFTTLDGGASARIEVRALADDDTIRDDDYWTRRYDYRYSEIFQGSVRAFFGEPYGDAIADYILGEYSKYAKNRNKYDNFNVKKTFGNITIETPLYEGATKDNYFVYITFN